MVQFSSVRKTCTRRSTLALLLGSKPSRSHICEKGPPTSRKDCAEAAAWRIPDERSGAGSSIIFAAACGPKYDEPKKEGASRLRKRLPTCASLGSGEVLLCVAVVCVSSWYVSQSLRNESIAGTFALCCATRCGGSDIPVTLPDVSSPRGAVGTCEVCWRRASASSLYVQLDATSRLLQLKHGNSPSHCEHCQPLSGRCSLAVKIMSPCVLRRSAGLCLVGYLTRYRRRELAGS